MGASLQFEASPNIQLMLTLLGAIVLILVGFGLWQLARRKWRDGIVCLAGALGPVAFIPILAVSAAVRYGSGNRRGGNASLFGAIMVAGGAISGVAVFYASGRTQTSCWLVLLAMEVAIAVGVFYGAVYAYLGTRRVAALMALRCAAILALMLALFKPALSLSPQVEAAKPYLPVLVDRSASMGTADQGGQDRYLEAIQMLNSQQGQIEKDFRPMWYHFGPKAQMAESLAALAALKPAGEGTEATNIAGAIRTAAAARSRMNLAGVLLLSDGIHNTTDNVPDAAAEAGIPIYAIGVGSLAENVAGARNIELVAVSAPLEAVKDNVTTVSVRVKIDALPNTSTEVQLFEEGSSTPVATGAAWSDKPSTTATVDLKWTPKDRIGAASSAAAGGPKEESGRSEVRKLRIVIPENPAETNRQDNSADLHILVTEPRVRVLYVEGSMRPEYKFLKRMFDTDQNIQFMGLVRITGAKFLSQGSVGGQRLEGLPASDEDFKLFDVIIIGDLDRTFWSSDQLARLRRFVNDGGGLAMLGGHNSFGPGGYAGTDLEAVLPVLLGNRSQPQESTPFLPQLTSAGEAHPIFEGIADYFPGPGNRKPKEGLPGLTDLLGCVTVPSAKPGATVLAVHPGRTNENGPLTVLAVQPFGAGRCAAFTADTTWNWYLPLQGMGADSPYQRFWGQLVRWLANVQTKSRQAASAVVLRMDRAYLQAGQTISLLARVQDDKGRAADNAQVVCTIAAAGDNAVQPETVPLSAGRGAGVFEGAFRAQKEGTYTVKAVATDSAGKSIGQDELALKVAPHSAEMDHLARDEALLRSIADKSGGAYADIFGLPDVLRQIQDRQRGRSPGKVQAQTFSLHNFAALFIVFVGLITGEWLLRRSWQLH